MTVTQLYRRLSLGPCTTADLRRAGYTDAQIFGLVSAGVAVILQHHDDPEAEIIGAYRATRP